MLSITKKAVAVMALLSVFALPAYAKTPRLVLQITVDQLRGDLAGVNREHLGKDGLAWILNKGVHYTNAHYEHANTETVVGHATLATGAQPSDHGMVANVWLDRKLGRLVYNIEDPDYRLLTRGAGVDADAEIDPTQRAAKVEGRSPSMMHGTTFSDELNLATNGLAKIFGVSVKDRGAVTMAGHGGTAYWFSKASGDFVTSNYYMDQYPSWVSAWNDKNHPQRYANTEWALIKSKDQYRFGASDDNAWETDLPGWGRVFPHHFGKADSKMFNTLLTISPAGDELTVDFALELLEKESLGQDEVTDYLSVSLSSTDYIGHVFGPSSLEAEENILRLDTTLARLLENIDKRVGLENTVVVLSADHGGPDAAGYMKQHGIATENINVDGWDTSKAMNTLKKRFGIGGKLIDQYYHPYLYLNHEVIKRYNLKAADVERAVADVLTTFDGVNLAIPSSQLLTGQLPDTFVYQAVLNNHNPERSGDIYIVFDPNRFINDFDGLTVAASHGSPWSYDTFVPVVVVAPQIKARKVHRKVSPASIAPTLSAILKIKPPSASRAPLLVEALK